MDNIYFVIPNNKLILSTSTERKCKLILCKHSFAHFVPFLPIARSWLEITSM